MMEWFKRHLNWTWVIFYILTLCLAYSLLVYTVSLPPPMKMKGTPGYYKPGTEKTIPMQAIDKQGNVIWEKPMKTLGEYVEGTTTYVIDEKAQDAREFAVLIWWWWPIYIIGTILGSRWVLERKGRSLHWTWLIFLFPPTPLILDNRCTINKATESDSGQSQTSAVHHSDGYNDTHSVD